MKERGPRRPRFVFDVMNEFELIERFFTRPPRGAGVRLAVGDDAALLAPTPGCDLVAAVDMLVSGRHFLPDTDPEGLGHKVLAVNLSDMAAMGAQPRWALLAGALPTADAAWLAAFARGFHALADEYAVDLVGGDTTAGPLNLCVTILGEVPRGAALLRSGAHAGDDIYVSGPLGDAALALAALQGRVKLDDDAYEAARRRLERPQPRVALGIALRGIASAALDVSDGLTGDLGHILERSGVGARVEIAAMPRSAALAAKLAGPERDLALACLLAGGDDYELCFTAPVAHRDAVARLAATHRPAPVRIGSITAGRELVVVDEAGERLPRVPRAFDHFGSAR